MQNSAIQTRKMQGEGDPKHDRIALLVMCKLLLDTPPLSNVGLDPISEMHFHSPLSN